MTLIELYEPENLSRVLRTGAQLVGINNRDLRTFVTSLQHTFDLLPQIPGWELSEGGQALSRTFRFKDYYATMAFVNALAWIAHREDHHPDLGVHYDRAVVRFSTHDVGGLSENDFICAAKTSALTEQLP